MDKNEILAMGRHDWDCDIDFSGYISIIERIQNRDYISPISPLYSNIENKLSMLEDTKFMTHLDNLGAVNVSEPFIFYRMYSASDRLESTWKEAVFNGI